ncbi:MAG: hypothetical protein EOP04_28835 [Proteobacteria bacterium]|nr:MAG: hypothetical protein EOP04_28835 [Pseudomonadota bacterium]
MKRPEFAIVDIETTGGSASNSRITEIAIIILDGDAEISRFETLIDPGRPIPLYIQSLTGITDAMVSRAPKFESVAAEIYALLKDRIFVAHNVNFDYSFVRHELRLAGITWEARKLCTVRAARKVRESHVVVAGVWAWAVLVP